MATETPDYAEEIVGYRAWRVEPGSLLHRAPTLLSLYDETPWRKLDWTYAACDDKRPCDPVPGERCSCGIYAARSRRALFEMAYGLGADEVIGEVGLAGGVILGTKGYRAERARPRRLYVAHTQWQLVRPLRKAYQVPVELANVLRRPG